jgi:Kef-type K+ transport system membrane component KefB
MTPLGRLPLQILTILVAARACGWLARRLGQPSVIGEIAAGLLLGPSVLGAVAPGVLTALFPEGSLGPVRLLSQVGVLLFMFTVGMELRGSEVRRHAGRAIAVSAVAILVPFLLGVASAVPLYADHAPPGIPFQAFGLFMGVAMSITAFPVLARLLDERGLTSTPLGVTALTSAAAGDVMAWTLLSLVVALVTGGESGGEGTGAHAILGAFLAGAVMPGGRVLRALQEPLETLSVFLLPFFFASTGLRTDIGLLGSASAWIMCLALIAVATIGKLGASAVTARITGLGWRDALILGALMNTRGLMELVALNVGLELGVISREIFTALVLMALATTAMTGPLVDGIRK